MSSILVIFVGDGAWSNFVGSESGQKQSVKLLQNMVYNTIQHPPPLPPHSLTLSVYTVHLVWEGGEVREKVEGQQHISIVPLSMGATVHKLGRKYQPWMKVSPVYTICLNTMPQSLLTGQFYRKADIRFGVFIVHSSMVLFIFCNGSKTI